jgi:translation initiation factor 1
MKNNEWKNRSGMVYSTNPDFNCGELQDPEAETLPAGQQSLRVSLDKRNRGGKTVTLISGFRGKAGDLVALGKRLKVKCGAGGTVKDGEIILQGDLRQKAADLLAEEGYSRTKII